MIDTLCIGVKGYRADNSFDIRRLIMGQLLCPKDTLLSKNLFFPFCSLPFHRIQSIHLPKERVNVNCPGLNNLLPYSASTDSGHVFHYNLLIPPLSLTQYVSLFAISL